MKRQFATAMGGPGAQRHPSAVKWRPMCGYVRHGSGSRHQSVAIFAADQGFGGGTMQPWWSGNEIPGQARDDGAD